MVDSTPGEHSPIGDSPIDTPVDQSAGTGDPTLTTVNLSTDDTHGLAAFYAALLGWTISTDEPGWAVVRAPAGGVALAFQEEPDYRRPVWPGASGDQQMMMHLEIKVDDLDAGSAHAVACGAVLADHQPQDDVRVHLDPAGHPFCLWLG